MKATTASAKTANVPRVFIFAFILKHHACPKFVDAGNLIEGNKFVTALFPLRDQDLDHLVRANVVIVHQHDSALEVVSFRQVSRSASFDGNVLSPASVIGRRANVLRRFVFRRSEFRQR